jgi:hypothetical protein
MAQLAPVSRFPVLFPSQIAQQEETIVFRGRQTDNSYDVSTVDGRALFAVEPVPSLGRRMRVLDAHGKNIFCPRKETFHIGGNRYFIEKSSRPQNTKLLTLEFKMFAIGRNSLRLLMTLSMSIMDSCASVGVTSVQTVQSRTVLKAQSLLM